MSLSKKVCVSLGSCRHERDGEAGRESEDERDALDVALHLAVGHAERLDKALLGLRIVLAQERKDGHVVRVRDAVRSRKGRERRQVGRIDAPDDVLAQRGRVELRAERKSQPRLRARGLRGSGYAPGSRS